MPFKPQIHDHITDIWYKDQTDGVLYARAFNRHVELRSMTPVFLILLYSLMMYLSNNSVTHVLFRLLYMSYI